MNLLPYKDIIKLSKEKIDEAMAPIRARQVKSKAELEMAKLDDQILTLSTKVQELFLNKEVDFPTVIEKLDELALLERRKEQYEVILGQLFPAADA